MPERRSVQVRISGRVQGVGFRAWTVRNASELGLSGWVRNCDDGSVEAMFNGQSDVVAEMLGRCESGPRYARVDAVELLESGAFDPIATNDDVFVVRR